VVDADRSIGTSSSAGPLVLLTGVILALDPRRRAVMYAGMVVEQGLAEAITRSPRHPHTRALLDAIPGTSPAERRLRDRRRAAEGIVSAAAAGCPYSTRCPLATDVCRAEKPALEGGGHRVACHHADAPAA
jgi:oligopeptide/dipeptide ABC transporter ATP-binding protein